MPRPRRFQPLPRTRLIARLRELGYEVSTAQDALTALSGVVVSQAAEIDELGDRIALIEGRQPTAFGS